MNAKALTWQASSTKLRPRHPVRVGLGAAVAELQVAFAGRYLVREELKKVLLK